MFWLFGKKTPTKEELLQRAALSPLYEGDRGLHNLTEHDAVLRVWMPTTADIALNDMAVVSDMTASDYLRQCFASYLYGVYELERMRKHHTGVFYDVKKHPDDLAAIEAELERELAKIDAQAQSKSPIQRTDNPPMFSRARREETIPDLGKNIVPLKLRLATKLKDDLQSLADRAGMPLSRFVREILVSHLLGHTVWPQRFPMIEKAEEQLATDWESNED